MGLARRAVRFSKLECRRARPERLRQRRLLLQLWGPSLSRMARIRLFLRSIFLVVAVILPHDVIPADHSIPEPQVHAGGVLGCSMLDGVARRSAVSSCTLARVYRCDLLSTNSFEGLVLRGGGDGGDDGLDIVKRTQKSVHWLAFERILAHQVVSPSSCKN